MDKLQAIESYRRLCFENVAVDLKMYCWFVVQDLAIALWQGRLIWIQHICVSMNITQCHQGTQHTSTWGGPGGPGPCLLEDDDEAGTGSLL